MAPGKIVCIGWNYRSHVKELESELPKVPTVFLKPSTCLIGDGDEIVIPAGVTNVQHEVELAVVFGRRCKDATEDDALDYVSHVPVPLDAVADIQDLELTLTVNGEVRQHGNTRDMIFPVVRLIAYVTRFMTMEPGDILITGTPEGVSEIRPGDTVRAEIAGVGTVTNRVVGS